MIALAILIPVILNFIYITRILESLFDILGIQVFDITPIVYTWSILVFVYATFKYEFFNITPIMKHEIAKKLDTPIVILDQNSHVLFTNYQFDSVFPDIQIILEMLRIKNPETNIMQYDNRFYQYYINTYPSISGMRFIIGFTDITAYELAKMELDRERNELHRANGKLKHQIEMLKQSSRVGARNYIARELHDILGHALVVTIKLLEVSKLFYKDNPNRAYDSLEKANSAIQNGFAEMKDITSKDSSQSYNTATLERELKSMLKVVDVSGVQVSFFIRGRNTVIDETIYDTLKKISTELVTNTLKHSNATKLLVSIIIYAESIVLQTMDNGKGVKQLVKGNGLHGIDGRLSLVQGKAKYTAEENEGFSCHISIPI